MAKKKVTEAKTEEYHDGYVTYMNYFATGEGMTHEIQFCWADSPKEAKEKHLDKFGYKDAEGRKYFGAGVVVYQYQSKDARELFEQFFKDGDKFSNIMQSAVFDLQFKVYWNFS